MRVARRSPCCGSPLALIGPAPPGGRRGSGSGRRARARRRAAPGGRRRATRPPRAPGRSAATAGNGGSITSTIGGVEERGSETAWRSRPRSPTEPTTVDGSCALTTGSCETRCSCSSATAWRTRWSRLDGHERRHLAGVALGPQHVADGAVDGPVEEAVLRHPVVVEDLAQVGAPAVREDHVTSASGSSSSRATCDGRVRAPVPQEPPARIPSVIASRRVMRKESRSDTVIQRSTTPGRTSSARSPRPRPRRGRA